MVITHFLLTSSSPSPKQRLQRRFWLSSDSLSSETWATALLVVVAMSADEDEILEVRLCVTVILSGGTSVAPRALELCQWAMSGWEGRFVSASVAALGPGSWGLEAKAESLGFSGEL